MSNELKFTLDTNINRPQVLKCKQYDDRTLICSLYSNSVPYIVTGAIIILNAKKPDGTWVKQDVNITIASNTVTIVLDDNITRVSGDVNLELKVTLVGKDITTFTFLLRVEPSVIQDGDLQSGIAITAVQALDDKINSANIIKTQLEIDIANGDFSAMRSDINAILGGTKDITYNTLTTIAKTVKGSLIELNTNKQPKTDNTLTTTAKTIPASINEHDSEIGNMSTATTTAKTCVGAINELDAQVGNVAGMTTTSKVVAGAIDELDSCKTEDSTLVGMVVYFAKNTSPTGFLKCNGATISRITYARLFSVIGTTFGTGDGSTTFKLPDLRDEFIQGWDDGRGLNSRTFGSWIGDQAQKSGFENTGWGLVAGGSFTDRVYITTNAGNYAQPRNVALLACIKY